MAGDARPRYVNMLHADADHFDKPSYRGGYSWGMAPATFVLRYQPNPDEKVIAAAANAVADLIGDSEPRVAFMDYYEYRREAYVIVSGVMGATCERVVVQRLKGSGRPRSEPSALAMARLIRYRLHGD